MLDLRYFYYQMVEVSRLVEVTQDNTSRSEVQPNNLLFYVLIFVLNFVLNENNPLNFKELFY